MRNADTIAQRYVSLWNQPDAGRRRDAIADLFAEDGVQILQPPEEIRARAQQLGFLAPTLEARGHQALEFRVTRSYEEFIAPGRFAFRQRDTAEQLGDVVKFRWEMVSVDDGAVAGVGLEVLCLDGAGRIRRGYQFVEA